MDRAVALSSVEGRAQLGRDRDEDRAELLKIVIVTGNPYTAYKLAICRAVEHWNLDGQQE